MRSVTLSCITFQWMSTRVHWSFQAVGGQTYSPLIAESVISTAVSVIYQKSLYSPSPCPLPHLLEAGYFKLVPIYHLLHQEREEATQSHVLDRLNELCTFFCAVTLSVSSFICHLHCALAAHLLLSQSSS